MTSFQPVGLLLIAMGAYHIICATWKRDFIFYRVQLRRMTRWGFSEGFAHIFYQVGGGILVMAGLLIASGAWHIKQ